MTKTQFTLGEWWLREPSHSVVMADADTEIARVMPSDNREANAKLIALAPEMFCALESIQATIRADELLSIDHELAAHADAIDTLLRPIRGEQSPLSGDVK